MKEVTNFWLNNDASFGALLLDGGKNFFWS